MQIDKRLEVNKWYGIFYYISSLSVVVDVIFIFVCYYRLVSIFMAFFLSVFFIHLFQKRKIFRCKCQNTE